MDMIDNLDNVVKETLCFGEAENAGTPFCVAMAGTKNYIPHIGMVMMSLCKYNQDLPVNFHLFVDVISDVEKARLREAAEQIKHSIYVHIMDDAAFDGLISKSYSAGYFYRYAMPDYLSKYAKRILYMDGDIMVHGDLSRLVYMDMGEKVAAVVTDRNYRKQSKRLDTEKYFNSGIMLIDIEQWQKQDILSSILRETAKCLENLDRKGHRKGWNGLYYNDQNILNKVLDGKLLWLPKKYNYLYILDRNSPWKKQFINEEYKNQMILHFAGHAKPWHSWVQDWPVIKEYRKLQLASPWEEEPLIYPLTYKNMHQAARVAGMHGQYMDMMKWYIRYLGNKIKGRNR